MLVERPAPGHRPREEVRGGRRDSRVIAVHVVVLLQIDTSALFFFFSKLRERGHPGFLITRGLGDYSKGEEDADADARCARSDRRGAGRV